MSRFTIFLVAGMVVSLIACKSGSTSSASPSLTSDQVETKLLKITGLKVPETAINLSGTEMSLFTYVFDCTFDCPLTDLGESWQNAPRLAEQIRLDDLDLGDGGSLEVFKGSWIASGGTQFVNISLADAEGDQVRVEVRTTHE